MKENNEKSSILHNELKGYFVFKNFVDKFGTKNIEYIVSSSDANIKKDYFEEIQSVTSQLIKKKVDEIAARKLLQYWMVPQKEYSQVAIQTIKKHI